MERRRCHGEALQDGDTDGLRRTLYLDFFRLALGLSSAPFRATARSAMVTVALL